MRSGQINAQNWINLAIINSKPDLSIIDAYSTFGEHLLIFIQVIVRKREYGRVLGRY